MYKYKINDRVFVADSSGLYPGTISAVEGNLYMVDYDGGGYDWLLSEELMPAEYHRGDYVRTAIGIGKVVAVDSEHDMLTVSYGGNDKIFFNYYEFEVKPAPKPSLWARLRRKDVYLYA